MWTIALGGAFAALVPAGGNLPRPLSPADGAHTFTYDSVQRRLPLIAEAVINNNEFPAPLVNELRSLASEIAAGKPLLPLENGGNDWDDLLAPFLDNGDTWFSAPWWVAENYFYKRMLELTDAAEGVGPTTDPFAKQKADSLAGSAGAFQSACAAGLTETSELAELVAASLWGNLADLSLSAGAALITPEAASSGEGATDGADSRMLCDDTAALCAALGACGGQEILIVLDNCGLELVSDLLLVDGLLRTVKPSRIVLHAKDRPVFVSDVQPKDMAYHVEWLAQTEPQAGSAMAARLQAALADGRLVVEAPTFYTSGRAFWEMPSEIYDAYASAAVVITKGDANYRRLLGDLHWAHDYSFSELVGSYWPKGTAVAALRTCKSGVLVGTTPEAEAAAVAAAPDDWLVAGKYGVVQLAPAVD